tara:strand:- start:15 stop:1712 length:1698 start_codon:yes stop_codon:yes gene_type:complete
MANPIDIGRKIYQVLTKLYGETFVKNLIGRQTNIKKLTKLDPNAPTENIYSKSALRNEGALEKADSKIQEYAANIFAEKNRMKQMNFLENAENVLASRNAQTGTTESMVRSVAESMFGPLGKKATKKPEAEIVDIKTQEKVKPEGIETLKSEVGLPEGVEPGSMADKAIKESAEYKMRQQGVESLLDPKYKSPKTTTIAEDDVVEQAEDIKGGIENLEEQAKGMLKMTDEMGDSFAKAYSAGIEGRRRAVMRQVLLRDKRLNLPEDVRDSLNYMRDLSGQEYRDLDPLILANKYYKRDIDKLEELDFLTTQYNDPVDAADAFIGKTPLDIADEGKDLGDKLKDLPDDIPDMAEGGRIGYSAGSKLRIAKFFADKGMNLARELKKAVDDIFPSGDRKLDADVVVDNMLEDLGVDRDMFEQKDISNLYGMAYDTLSEGSVPKGLAAFTTKKGKGEVKMADEIEVSQDVKNKVDYNKQKMEDEFMKRAAPKLFLRMELKARFPGITDDMIAKIMADDNPQRIAEVLASMDEGLKMMEKGMSTDEIINTFKKTPRTKQAGGGLSYLMGM